MATIYVSSNADSGTGTLRQAILDAASGDEIRFSETVFERGAPIEIALLSALDFTKSLTFGAAPFRVVLDCGGASRAIYCRDGAELKIVDFDFRGGKTAFGAAIASAGKTTLVRCSFCGGDSRNENGGNRAGSAVYLTATDSELNIDDCAIYGNIGMGAVYSKSNVNIVRSTIVGNIGGDVSAPDKTINAVDSIFADGTFDDFASYNFVAPPSSSYSASTWTLNSWKTLNFRLLDDGSATPSNKRDSGTVPAASVLNDADDPANFDLDGNWRVRTQIVSGQTVTSRSPGAFETVQADLFWIGKDASGGDVLSPSWTSASGWATSRFATASNATAPPASGQTVFVGGKVDFVDAPTSGIVLIVGGYAKQSYSGSSSVTLGLQTGFCATLDWYRLLLTRIDFAPHTRINDFVGFRAADWRIGENVYVNVADVRQYPLPCEPTYYSVNVYLQNNVPTATIFSGRYLISYGAMIYVPNASKNATLVVAPDTQIETPRFSVVNQNSSANVANLTSTPFEVVLTNAAVAEISSTFAPSQTFADDFRISLDDAASATLTLRGQTICGTVVGAATLSGNAVVDEALSTGTLKLNADARLQIAETATVRVDNLTTANGARLDGDGELTLSTSSVWSDSGATVNDVATSEYAAETNALQIVVDDPNDATPSFRVENGAVYLTNALFQAGLSTFELKRHSPGSDGANGSYVSIYDSSNVVDDPTEDVYETTATWLDGSKRTIVDAAPNDGWNFYQIGPKEPVVKGLASLRFDPSKTRRIAVWAGDGAAPVPTYYYAGAANGSFVNPADWALSADGTARVDGSPQFDGATVVFPRVDADFAEPIRVDGWNESVAPATLSVEFPNRVAIFSGGATQIELTQELEASEKLASFGVPTPTNATFFVGVGGTLGRWNAVDGATEYEIESLETPLPSTFSAPNAEFLEPSETVAKSWRVRVKSPIYGAVENWSTATAAQTPLASFAENAEASTLATSSFTIGYATGYPGAETATIKRRSTDSDAWTILTDDFDGVAFSDAPPTSAEHVYRLEWNAAPNVWLEARAARRDVFPLSWFVETTFVDSNRRLASETPTFAARIFRKTTGALLRRDEVKAVRYSLFATRKFGEPRVEGLAVDRRGNYCAVDVSVPLASFRDSLLVDANFWTRDDLGFNFAFAPQAPLFPEPGRYVVRTAFDVVLAEDRADDETTTFFVDFFVDAK